MPENNDNKDLEFNREKREKYEKLMKESSTNLDGYWDKNNLLVKFILIVLGLVIVIGAGYIFYMYFNTTK